MITFDDLARQREEFALDSAADRPYHAIAHARARRGYAWNDGSLGGNGLLAEARRSTLRASEVPAELARLRRLYAYEEPFLRTGAAASADRERWSEALRRGAGR